MRLAILHFRCKRCLREGVRPCRPTLPWDRITPIRSILLPSFPTNCQTAGSCTAGSIQYAGTALDPVSRWRTVGRVCTQRGGTVRIQPGVRSGRECISTGSAAMGWRVSRRMVLIDGQAGVSSGVPSRLLGTAPAVQEDQAYGLAVWGSDMVAYVDPVFPGRRRDGSGGHRRGSTRPVRAAEGGRRWPLRGCQRRWSRRYCRCAVRGHVQR